MIIFLTVMLVPAAAVLCLCARDARRASGQGY